jgi:dipeptidyl aminopeptidase/acylaminoacyl peptidase
MSIARDLTPSPASIEPYGEGATTLAISRQGRLVYARAVRNASIWRLNLNSGIAPAPFISSTMDDHAPAYSPDGHRIAFASTRSGTEEIWLANSDGSNLIQLTQMNGPKTANPQFSPDGRQLVFDSQKEGLSDLYLINLASGDVKRLTTGPGNKIQARWSQDGRSLYYSCDAGGTFQIWKMSSEGGRAWRISDMLAYRAEESWDGKTLYLAQHTSLWSVGLGDRAHDKPVQLLDDLSYSLNFAVTHSGIYYLSAASSGALHSTVKFFDPATRVGRTVQDIDKRWWFGLALSPDERSLLYSVRDADGSDLVMVEGIR